MPGYAAGLHRCAAAIILHPSVLHTEGVIKEKLCDGILHNVQKEGALYCPMCGKKQPPEKGKWHRHGI